MAKDDNYSYEQDTPIEPTPIETSTPIIETTTNGWTAEQLAIMTSEQLEVIKTLN